AVPPVMAKKLPPPASNTAVTFPVVLIQCPRCVPVTLTEKEHEPVLSKFNASSVMLLLPGLAITAAPLLVIQVPVAPLGVATTRPAGRTSVNPMLTISVLLFGFARLNVSEVLVRIGMPAAPKTLVTAGGKATDTPTVLLGAPAPLSLDETGPAGVQFFPR